MSKKNLVAELENIIKNKEEIETKDMVKIMKKTGISFKQIVATAKSIKKQMQEKKEEQGESFKATEFLEGVVNDAKAGNFTPVSNTEETS